MEVKTDATVEDIIETVVRPLLARDGGTVEVLEVTADQVTVRLAGAYAGCPGRTFVADGVIAPALSKGLGRAIAVRSTP